MTRRILCVDDNVMTLPTGRHDGLDVIFRCPNNESFLHASDFRILDQRASWRQDLRFCSFPSCPTP